MRSDLLRLKDRRLVLTLLVFLLSSVDFSWGQAGSAQNAEDVQMGHALAVKVCAVCHIAAPDQPSKPMLAPPAPSFASIVRQKSFDAESLTHFLATTHRGLDNPKGMPNIDLADYQIKEIVAYFLSLYK